MAPKWADDLIEEWYAAYNAGDVEGVARLYSDGAVGSEGVRGREAIEAQLAARKLLLRARDLEQEAEGLRAEASVARTTGGETVGFILILQRSCARYTRACHGT